ncbi:MAG: hypothetical protein OCD01_00715 [Fibrobacterales bacterium]
MADLTFSGQTDEVITVDLPSRIIYAKWRGNATSAGGVITIEVMTQWVANGSAIKVTVKDRDDGQVEVIEGKVWNNLFRKDYVPEPNDTQGLKFTAELADHSLEADSNVMRVFPTVTIENLQFLNGEDEAVLEAITKEENIILNADITGPPDGTKAIVSLYCKVGEFQEKFIFSNEVVVEGGSVTASWKNNFPIEEEIVKADKVVKKDAEEYFNPAYYFSVECYATKVKSDDVPYKSWAVFNLNQPGRTAVFVLPDGEEKEESIPADGIVKMEQPAVGEITLKEIKD